MRGFVLRGEWNPIPGISLGERELTDHRAYVSGAVWNNLSCQMEDVQIPEPKEDEVLIKVGACGVCGSDIHSIEVKKDGYMVYNCHTRLPVILGHEFSGEIAEVGKKLKGQYQVGDIIAVEQIHYCGHCHNCRSGLPNCCDNREDIGLSKNGAFCEYAVVPEKYIIKINDLAEKYGDKLAAFEAGALAEPMSVAYHSIMINAGGFQPGSNVAVVGAGPIGLSAAALCRASGAAKIFMFDTNRKRLAFAQEMGIADGCFNPMDFASDYEIKGLLMELTHGLGCHINIEAAGNPGATYPMIAAVMASHAKLVQIGLPGKIPPIDLIPFIYHGTSIYCCSGSAGYDIFPSVLRMFATGRLDIRNMISKRYPLEQTKEAIGDAAAGTPGKVMVSQFY